MTLICMWEREAQGAHAGLGAGGRDGERRSKQEGMSVSTHVEMSRQ